MKPVGKALAFIAGAVVLLAAAAAQAQEVRDEAGVRYTAQRRPRVAVLELDDTNREASNKGYAASVESMLVTALQSRTQFAVAERQKLGGLLEEKRRIQRGMVDVSPGDTSSLQLLEKLDAYVYGTVTLLDSTRIEIDTRLFSSFDGRVAATARGNGPEACLRPIVERLAAALEEDFLRSYYGNVQMRLTAPENVRIFLTPLPLGTASGAEKAPAERSSTIVLGGEYDTVETWMTDPTSATIEKLLPGWYSLRLARPGYEDFKADPARFAVHVEPQATKVVDLDALGFVLRKKRGSLAPRVKRQYLDKDSTRVPRRAILMGGRGLDLNRFEAPKEPGDDPQCDPLREQSPLLPGYGRTYVPAGQKFDFGTFQGGELIIEDYQGEIVPAGQYQLALWESGYQVKKIARRLEVIDLLVLGPQDMARLRQSSEDAAIVESYIRKGGALFAFVTEPGDYGAVAGAPLAIKSTGRPTNDFALSLGEVTGMLPWLEKKADAPSKRILPELVRFHPSLWRVLAFTRGRESPRVLERGRKEDGGYVVLWLDDPGSFRDSKGKTVPQVEEIRARVEEGVLKWARHLMYRRYDKGGKLRRQAEEELGW
jgi:Curli production assembly/transport component CsgG